MCLGLGLVSFEGIVMKKGGVFEVAECMLGQRENEGKWERKEEENMFSDRC